MAKVAKKRRKYIPIRYLVAMALTICIIASIIGSVIALCYYYPKLYALSYLVQVACVLKIVASDDNPDYKVPWLLFVLILPITGFMLYIMFYSRKLKRRFIKRLKEINDASYDKCDNDLLAELKKENLSAHNQALMLLKTSGGHLFKDCQQTYLESGQRYMDALIKDLKSAKNFIFIEYFIMEKGKFLSAVIEVLKEKALAGVEVKLVYDDIGCMVKLPANYYRTLKKYGIKATPFSKIRGSADSEFNNRSHRKIAVIDGKIAYTGGVNIADEYINEFPIYGDFKDGGIRIEGEGVWEFTKLFLFDYGMNIKEPLQIVGEYFPKTPTDGDGYIIPFGDGPAPLYKYPVSKGAIQNLLSSAKEYCYITTPYLIIDNDLCQDIENCAMRGVDVKIIVPHIPDKKIVFEMSKSYCERLVKSGVKIYEYTPGFIHAKNYVSDDSFAIIGTVNLDYRSLVHHFENGVWMYKCDCIKDIKQDFLQTLDKCQAFALKEKHGLIRRFFRSVIRIFAPLL